ncbi:hypothetical protein [Nocardiopsis lambiniae]|uniref:Aminoglycoside phosphotransferase domain-containing protein n=1 Tax=Nocardiopsis lambiniae TaxID=3075539 RepID=A0ABU2M2Y0_9ACTN|nr:hypothetical protein [Nocardiopsis sp. DSM 44743]MDT0327004.1 hypothetical protein [Nocardiopsis sp. DSM 44743]
MDNGPSTSLSPGPRTCGRRSGPPTGPTPPTSSGPGCSTSWVARSTRREELETVDGTPLLHTGHGSSEDRAALEHLARTDTDRVSLLQEDLDHSISEAFGTSIDTTISDWAIGHGDLHWANLTAPRLFLLDWDGWGMMPRGLDAAKLWESAFRVPDFTEEITQRLTPDLTSRDGKLSRLWVCANRILGARRRGKATDQTEHAHRTGRSLLAELS